MTHIAPKAERMMVRWGYHIPEAAIAAIRKRFNIPRYTTINGLSPAEISADDMPVFEETARRGFFSILRVKWRKNGDAYSF
ncbi:MAG: hypothetical protein NC187_08120 [Candidatus Amulumruptor caecigallinarius]|nr:hypothetical protein [Candidatus Amulumruptor caecigallinarius]MCM1397434.1 hypothetical protein [Candidatus Amulumruptor caecigallinarius]MCM1454358.1 hypothetical protein [bacterium]